MAGYALQGYRQLAGHQLDMALFACRPVASTEGCSVAECAGICLVARQTVIVPRFGMGHGRQVASRPFTPRGERADGEVEPGVAAGPSRGAMATLADDQVCSGCRTVQLGIGKGEGMADCPRPMAVRMATGEIPLVETVYFRDSAFQISTMTLLTLQGIGLIGCPMGGHPACRVFIGRVQRRGAVVPLAAARQRQGQKDNCIANYFHRSLLMVAAVAAFVVAAAVAAETAGRVQFSLNLVQGHEVAPVGHVAVRTVAIQGGWLDLASACVAVVTERTLVA